MPAKKIIDAVGSTCAVIGSSIATVTAGPRPGSTPMAVPSAQPMKAHIRLIGVRGGGETTGEQGQDVAHGLFPRVRSSRWPSGPAG